MFINEDILISNIDILTQGNSLEDTNDMREICKRFQLTKKQVRLYYFESRESTESEIHDSYDILPCNSTGTISINGEIFSWIIRAGGVGVEYFRNCGFFSTGSMVRIPGRVKGTVSGVSSRIVTSSDNVYKLQML